MHGGGKKITTSKAVTMHAIKTYGGAEVELNSFHNSALDGDERSVSRHGRSNPV